MWVIPLVAALIGVTTRREDGVGLRADHDHQLRAAREGLEPGKTKVKFKDVDIGTVKTITLSKDHSRVLVDVQLTKEATDFAVEGHALLGRAPARGGKRRGGLGTLYFGLPISAWMRANRRRPNVASSALETPPAVTGDQKGHTFALRRRGRSASLDIGSPDLLPARAGRSRWWRFVHARRHGRHAAGVRHRALRSVYRHQYALVACERRRSAARFERLHAQHAVTRDGRAGRHCVPDAAEPAARARRRRPINTFRLAGDEGRRDARPQ